MSSNFFVKVAVFAAGMAIGVSTQAGATQLVTNGGFTTGDFTGWTTFTTSNGTLGPSPLPQVSSFDVTGTGATNAAEFQVGGAVISVGTQQGGGLTQSITTTAGLLDFTADIAANANSANSSGGVFSVLLNGLSEDTVTFGDIDSMGAPATLRGELSFDASVSAGAQTLEILITRPFISGSAVGDTPVQYLTDVSAVQAAVPEPSIWAMMLLGFAGLGFAGYRRRGRALRGGRLYAALRGH